MAKDMRQGRGKANYKRERASLIRHAKANDVPCAWCNQPFDWTITDHNHPMYPTADHPKALALGGSLTGQELTLMHRSCNASKNNKLIPKGNLPTTELFDF